MKNLRNIFAKTIGTLSILSIPLHLDRATAAETPDLAEPPTAAVNQPDLAPPKVQKAPILVYCHASWCGPCRQVGPIVDKFALGWNGKVVKFDIENFPDNGLLERKKIKKLIEKDLKVNWTPAMILLNGDCEPIGEVPYAFDVKDLENQVKTLLEKGPSKPEEHSILIKPATETLTQAEPG